MNDFPVHERVIARMGNLGWDSPAVSLEAFKERLRNGCPAAANYRVERWGKYIGFLLGHFAALDEWNSAMAKLIYYPLINLLRIAINTLNCTPPGNQRGKYAPMQTTTSQHLQTNTTRIRQGFYKIHGAMD